MSSDKSSSNLSVKKHDIQIVGETKSSTIPLQTVLQSNATTKSVVKKTACTTLSPCLVMSSDKSSSIKINDIQIVGEAKASTMPIQTVLQNLNLKKHPIKGDGDCLYHSLAHQAGLVSQFSRGEEYISQQLRKVALSTMLNHDGVRKESGLLVQQWKLKRQEIALGEVIPS